MISKITFNFIPVNHDNKIAFFYWKAIINGRQYGIYYELNSDADITDTERYYPRAFQDILKCLDMVIANQEIVK